MILGISISVVLALSIFTTVYLVVIRNKKVDETVIIWGDRDFKAYNFPGKGTADDPYIIENYNIDTTSARGIYITDTTKHFIIRNCVIKAANTAIYISNAAEGTVSIINNECNDNGFYGIYIVDSPSSLLINNFCENNLRANGISIIESPNSNLTGNYCFNNTGQNELEVNLGNGIFITQSDNTTVKTNFCSDNNGHGIVLHKSITSEVRNNELDCNGVSGLFIDDSEDSIIIHNLFWHNILMFEDIRNIETLNDYFDLKRFTPDYFLSFTILDNYVNEQPLGYYTNFNDVVINESSDGQSIFVNCNNLTVDNSTYMSSLGRSFYYCHNAFVSNNTDSYNPFYGLALYHSNNVTITKNNYDLNGLSGIYLYNCNDSVITDNSCNQNQWSGIDPDLCWNTTISNNYCSRSEFSHGIHIGFSENYVIKNNTCVNNKEGGIGANIAENVLIYNNTLSENGHGLYFDGVKSFNVSYNTITNNEEHGIVFASKVYRESINNTIHNNLISDNIKYGVYLASYTNSSVIYHNSFRDNNPIGVSQGYDSGFDNTWYNNLIFKGNYWNDWIAGSYSIDGTATATDPYPLVGDPWP